MKTRDLLTVVAVLALLGALVYFALGTGPTADQTPMFAPPSGPAGPVAEAAPEPVVTPQAGAVTAMPATSPQSTGRTETPSGWTSGVIRGHIALDAAVVQKLRFVYVQVREAVNTAGGIPESGYVPWVKTVKEEIVPGAGTPTFAYHGVPFSKYGYFVRVYAEAVNGSKVFTQLTESNPIADVELSVTAGVPFSVLLRDQLKTPVPDQRVHMVPVGEPTGRPLRQEKTDNFGSAVFDNVLQGEYIIRVGYLNDPKSSSTTVQVHAHAGVRSATIEVPQGLDMTVVVQSIHGWIVEGAQITLHATDSVQYRTHQGTTDFGGRFVFEHLPPGKYQMSVKADGFSFWIRSVIMPKEGRTEPFAVALVPR